MDSIVTVMNSVFDALRHNPFGAGSLFVAFTVLIVFQWWRQRKAFSYKVMSDYSLFDVDKKFSDRVKILFDDKPVKRVSLVVVRLRNSGWVPIEDKDFFKPVEVSFGQESEIMSIETDETRPKDMGISAAALGSKFGVEPTLFNRGDFVRFKVLVHGYKGHVSVSGRIKGVPEIKREGPHGPADKLFIAVMVMILVSMIYTALDLLFTNKIIPIVIAALIYVLLYLFISSMMRNARPPRIQIYED